MTYIPLARCGPLYGSGAFVNSGSSPAAPAPVEWSIRPRPSSPLEFPNPAVWLLLDEFSRMRVDSSACAHRITVLARIDFVCRVFPSTNVTPRARFVAGSISTVATTAFVSSVHLPVLSASFTVVNGLLKYEVEMQPRSQVPQ